ncbi:vWA domain-containing protein [Paracoccus sp. S1E-3]|uniref:vWA domain-containing protein n=1 Tax=Paracoccus sp. S1E-3 TaxID=2756130 RepID=UPI0015EEF538|nr:vWA domain-containing protein [Paracoccus sp. S1E-3]MBA4492498.1 VWA domain-containing protein [Paracoccus sp. S1E-3]
MRMLPPKSALALFLLLALPGAATAEVANQAPQQKIQVAFVLDTTGSMVDLIEGAKQKIWSITNTILDVNPRAEISMALIGYRDRGDAYVIRPHHMTSDMQGLYSDLRRFTADGGGDTPESVNEALEAAVRGQDWAEGSDTRRIIFLVGDAPPHMDYRDGPRYAEVIAEARRKGIIVNTIQAGDDPETREYWQEMARLGGGQYHPIPQDGGQVVQIQTPYDDQIIKIQSRIDATILPYGSAAEQTAVRDKVSERATASASARADNSSYYAKKGGRREAVTGGSDLVADIANGDIALDAVPEAELSETLKGMSAAERAAHVEAQLQTRKQAEAEMVALVAKRDAYLAERQAQPGQADSFDASVKRLLKDQLG